MEGAPPAGGTDPHDHAAEIVVHRVADRPPVFWDRRAIFFANLLSLFYGNEQQTQVLREMVGSIETYGNRLLPLIGLLYRRSPNLLITEHRPDPSLVEYLGEDLQLALPDLEILPHRSYLQLSGDHLPSGPADREILERWRTFPAEWVDGFVIDRRLEALADKLGKQASNSFAGSRSGNNKLLLHRRLEARGLPVFDTFTAADPDAVARALHHLRRQGYPWAVIKAPVGASGIGMVRTPTDCVGALPEYLFQSGSCLVQGWLDETVAGVAAVGSPSVQFFAGEGRLVLFDLTEQILSRDSIHEGNTSPPPWLPRFPEAAADLWDQAEEVGRWLMAAGYRGTGSIDFLAIRRRGRLEIRVCEVNARVTGATYPSVLARHFEPGGGWMMRNLRFQTPIDGRVLLNRLTQAGMLYRPGGEVGVLPINFNLDDAGRTVKGQFLFLHRTPDRLPALLTEGAAAMGLDWQYDRD